MFRKRMLLALGVVLAFNVGVATASADNGNSENAKLCADSWRTLVRADQTRFANPGECIAYGAQGGTPASPKTASQLLCEAFGGTYSTDPTTDHFGFAVVLWTCNGAAIDVSIFITGFVPACVADFGSAMRATLLEPFHITCGHN